MSGSSCAPFCFGRATPPTSRSDRPNNDQVICLGFTFACFRKKDIEFERWGVTTLKQSEICLRKRKLEQIVWRKKCSIQLDGSQPISVRLRSRLEVWSARQTLVLPNSITAAAQPKIHNEVDHLIPNPTSAFLTLECHLQQARRWLIGFSLF